MKCPRCGEPEHPDQCTVPAQNYVMEPNLAEENTALRHRVRELENSYRCFSCKQVFGEILAKEHFGSHLNGDKPKCWEILDGTASWGGGPHDPFYRVRKEHYDAMEKENIELKARCARYVTMAEADADQL